MSYELINSEYHFLDHAYLYASNTWNDFHYVQYKQLGINYAGNKLPGVAPETITAGIDLNTKNGLYLNGTYFFSDRIAMDDANSAFANSYNLIGLRIGYKKYISKETRMEIFAGAENILNEKYSLGNDINATGGRYYNVAAGRNFYAGVTFRFNKKPVSEK